MVIRKCLLLIREEPRCGCVVKAMKRFALGLLMAGSHSGHDRFMAAVCTKFVSELGLDSELCLQWTRCLQKLQLTQLALYSARYIVDQ